MSTESSHGVTPQEICAYLDDELTADRVEIVSRALAEDPGLSAEYAQIGVLRGTVRASLEAEAEAVPSARFEQIWDEIDQAIERDTRLQADADRGASVWARLWAALRPVRIPVLAAAAAAAVTLVVVGNSGDEPNNSPAVASVDENPAAVPDSSDPRPSSPVEPESKGSSTELAAADPLVRPTPPDPEIIPMAVPENSIAEIHGVEFGGKSGRISNIGTVTVLYVEEDDAESTNSERSL